MFAQVIPALRTPRQVAFFDYAIPPDMTVVAGDLVRVPFRNKSIIGLVSSVSSEPSTQKRDLKFITESYGGIQFAASTLQILRALASRSFSSPATVLRAWIGTPPTRSGMSASVTRQASLLPTHHAQLLTNRWLATGGLIERALQAKKAGKRVLILTPWASSANALANHLDAQVLTSDQTPGARFRAWSGFIRGSVPILVTTRIGAWLTSEADLVIIDEPENDDHKQDELAPRFDARWLVTQAHAHGASVLEIGLTPRLTSAPESVSVIPPINPTLQAIDVHPSDWSAIAGLQNRSLLLLEQAQQNNLPVTIIHPIYGDRAHLRCKDCGWIATCARCGASPALQGAHLICRRCAWKGDAVAACPSCNGTQLSHSRPGRDTLKRDLTTHGFTDVRVCSIAEWNAGRTGRQDDGPMKRSSHQNPVRPVVPFVLSVLKPPSLTILTDLSSLSGGTEDARRRERLVIAFRRLADDCASMNAQLAVQSDALLLTDARSWLTAEGCAVALTREYADRKTFALPPATRLVKIIVRGPLTHAQQITQTLTTLRPYDLRPTLSGPYPVPHLPGSREPRSIIHLTFSQTTPDTTIQALLDPLLDDSMLIDLDPIAFFE